MRADARTIHVFQAFALFREFLQRMAHAQSAAGPRKARSAIALVWVEAVSVAALAYAWTMEGW